MARPKQPPKAPGTTTGLSFEDVGWHWRRYQLAFLNDTSQLVCIVKSRQIGASEGLGYLGPHECGRAPNTNVYYVSTNFKKSKDLLAKAVKWARAIALIGGPAVKSALTITSINNSRVTFANGSKMEALPCKAASVRGETGIIILDEVDHYANLWDIYAGIAPAITSSPDLRLIASTTPLGEDGLTYKVFNDPAFGAGWSKHRVTVYDAVADGHNAAVLNLRNQYTSDAWAQEFECAWVSDRDRYFSNDLLRACGAIEPPSDGASALGLDIGRTRDRSAWAEVMRDTRLAGLVDYDELPQGMPHNEQLDVFRSLITARSAPRRPHVMVDARGEGSGTYDHLRAEFGNAVQPFKATAALYEQAIPALKLAMEQGEFYLPNDPQVHSAFSRLQKTITVGGNVSFKAARDGSGHADLFYSTLMAFWRDYDKPAPPPSKGRATTVRRKRAPRLREF